MSARHLRADGAHHAGFRPEGRRFHQGGADFGAGEVAGVDHQRGDEHLHQGRSRPAEVNPSQRTRHRHFPRFEQALTQSRGNAGVRCAHTTEGHHVPETMPTDIAAEFAWAPIEAWASAAANATEYAARAIAGGDRHWALPRTWRSSPASRRFARSQRGHTKRAKCGPGPSRGCWTTRQPSATAVVPTLVLPPQAGHASSIVDYGPGPEPDADAARRRTGPPLRHRLAAGDAKRPRTGPSRSTSSCWRRRCSRSAGG